MTRTELLRSIAHLKWRRDDTASGALRCARGDCPILAAVRVHSGPKLWTNFDWAVAAAWLGIDKEEARIIVVQADRYGIPELEGVK